LSKVTSKAFPFMIRFRDQASRSAGNGKGGADMKERKVNKLEKKAKKLDKKARKVNKMSSKATRKAEKARAKITPSE
jgi:hypothetical protein